MTFATVTVAHAQTQYSSDAASGASAGAPPASLALSPKTSTKAAGTSHCVTATVKDAFQIPSRDISVVFTVTGANPRGGTALTDANGQARFCYTGTKAGTDTITAFADADNSGVRDRDEPGDTATNTYTPAAPATVALAPASASTTAGLQHCVTATIKDAFGNPTPGISAVFRVTGGNNASGTRTTSSSGQTSFCYTGTKAGTDTITAFADTNGNATRDTGEPSGSATNTYTAAAPATLALSPASATRIAGEQHCVTATVRDQFANPVSSVTVRFSVTGKNPTSGTRTTGTAGQGAYCYTGTKAGTDTITAFADTNGNATRETGEPTDSATNTYTAAAPASLTLLPASATKTAGQQHCVTATVKDRFGNATPAVSVPFTVSGKNSASGTRSTGAGGQATYCYTGTKAGTDTIAAFADTNGNATRETGEPTDSATNAYTAAAPASLALLPASATKTAGQQHCVTATVKDRFGNPTPGVSTVFTVTGKNVASGTGTTGAAGQSAYCYTGTTAGTDTIAAFADTNGDSTRQTGEPTDSATNAYTAAAPATLSLSPPTATKTAGQQHCVTATVNDRFGNPTPAVSAVFAVTGKNPRNGTRTTSATGQTSFCYTGTKAGTDTITAFADTNGDSTRQTGEPTDSATSTYTAATPASLTLLPASATKTAGQQHCVTATVKDRYANPNPNVDVVFSITGPNGGGDVKPSGADGRVSFCYTGTTAGTDTIAAFADTDKNGTRGASEPGDSATNAYTAANPAALALSPRTTTETAGQQHCVTATVNDRFGNSTPGVSVVFSVTGKNARSGTATTSATGQASFCYTGTKAGTDTIAAFADINGDSIRQTGEPSDSATNAYTAANPATLVLSPQSATKTAGQQHCVTATVKDQFGNPTPAVSVVFSVTGKNAGGATRTTGSVGRATYCYVGTKAGTDTINAFADTDGSGARNGTEPGDTATNVYTAAAPATLTLLPDTAAKIAGQQHCLTALVRDSFGNAVPDVSVRLTVTGANTRSGSLITSATGRATYCYTGTKAGTDTISAFADTNGNTTREMGEPADTATNTYSAAAPATLVLSPSTATGTVGQQHCVTATVKDEFRNANPNVDVVFSVTGANSGGDTKVTGSDGRASFCYTGTTSGSDTIAAFADTDGSGTKNGAEPADNATQTYTAAAPATLALSPRAATNRAGEEHCVSATVRDRFGNPTPAISTVFSVTGQNIASGTRATDANGQAAFCYTGTKAGTDTISAFADTNANATREAGEPGDSATKTYTPAAPASLTLTPKVDSNTVGQEHCVTAAVDDSYGNANPAVSVVFSVTGANPRSGSRTTDANGEAGFCYIGTKSGTDTISAFADTDGSGVKNGAEPGDTATKTYTAAAPATLALSPQSATNTAGTQHCVTASVRDSFANPVSGTTVRFSVTGANTTSGSRTTGANGEATFCYTGTKAGADTINAFADTDGSGVKNGAEPGDSATKTYTAAAPASLTLTPDSATNTAGEQHCVTAAVSDQYGNPNSGVSVVFSVTGANTAGETKPTGTDGHASFCYTGNTAGTDTIDAFADTNTSGAKDPTEPSDSATKTYTPATPATLTLSPKTATNTVGEEHCVTATVTDEFGNPNPDISVVFTVSGANAAGDTKLTGSDGQVSFCYTGTTAGADTIDAFADIDDDGAKDATEPGDTATKTYTAAAPTTLALSPKTATNTVGQEHCVTATVEDVFQNPNADLSVVFTVSGANTAGDTKLTGADGQATFCYTGTTAGTDTIDAFADTDASGSKDATEPGDTATKVYLPGP